MVKSVTQSGKPALTKINAAPPKIFYLLLVLAYGIIVLITPSFKALDWNGPRFLALSLLNLFTFSLLLYRREENLVNKNKPVFFNNVIGFLYSLFMLVALISFVKAINVTESILFFAKIFTTFSAACLVSILLVSESRSLFYLAVAMTVVLIIDSLTVFYGIAEYVQGKIASISDIKSIYSNKNILTAALFVKIPFAIWLMVFHEKRLRMLGIIAIFLGMLATLFMSARAFYLGLIVLSLVFAVYLLVKYRQTRESSHLRNLGIYFGMLIVSVLVFTAVQKYLYPATADARARDIGSRMASIGESSGGGRYKGWLWSWHVFKENPLLGVGLGNWKIATLKEENQTNPGFILQLKAHNDFIEVTTETGIIGGLLYLGIFLVTFGYFARSVLRKLPPAKESLIFLPFFGLLCYSFDAFFNFPQDRTEMASLFALYTAMLAAFATIPFLPGSIRAVAEKRSDHSYSSLWIKKAVIVLSGILLLTASGILWLNFKSLKLQYLVSEDSLRKKMKYKSAMFLGEFPCLPNLGVTGAPIAALKAYYLINEKKYEEAINLLKNDRSNPYSTLNEYHIGLCYEYLGNADSTVVYASAAYALKPNNFKNTRLLCNALLKTGRKEEAASILNRHLKKFPGDKDAVLYASSFFDKTGNVKEAVRIMDASAERVKNDSTVIKQREALAAKARNADIQPLFAEALKLYEAKNFREAARQFSTIIGQQPDNFSARQYRAQCYYSLKEYALSNGDIDFLISKGRKLPNLLNVHGVNSFQLGKRDEAEAYFKMAMEMGDKDGARNYQLLSKKQ